MFSECWKRLLSWLRPMDETIVIWCYSQMEAHGECPQSMKNYSCTERCVEFFAIPFLLLNDYDTTVVAICFSICPGSIRLSKALQYFMSVSKRNEYWGIEIMIINTSAKRTGLLSIIFRIDYCHCRIAEYGIWIRIWKILIFTEMYIPSLNQLTFIII